MDGSQPTAHLICGFIGAGKTTFARKLEAETGTIRVTKDEWLIHIFGRGIASDPAYPEYDRKVTELATSFAFKLLEAGLDVIIDEGFWSRRHRDVMNERVAQAGARPVLYFVDTPLDVMRARVRARTRGPSADSFEIDDAMFERYLPLWERPAVDEDFVRVV